MIYIALYTLRVSEAKYLYKSIAYILVYTKNIVYTLYTIDGIGFFTYRVYTLYTKNIVYTL